MNEKLTCTLYYNKKASTPHLWQIYTGFFELQKRGFIKVRMQHKDWLPESYTENLLMVDIDGQYKAIYDTNDGFNWIWGSEEDNLQYFQNTLMPLADFYFKRSYNDQLLEYKGTKNGKIFPLGVNYELTSSENKIDSINYNFKGWIKSRLRSVEWIRKSLKINNSVSPYTAFENAPWPTNDVPKILFLTRIWHPGNINKEKISDPEVVEALRQGLLDINQIRVDSIIECKKVFGSQFTGGLFCDNYSMKEYPDLVVPIDITRKVNFMKLTKQSDICISTNGLHKSIAWKFGEYVSAARGIISEKLLYDLPGNFSSPTNYLIFKDVDELIKNIHLLVKNKDMLRDMMVANYHYYNLYIRPDNLILNTLLSIKENVA